jgi:hypothetical protein
MPGGAVIGTGVRTATSTTITCGGQTNNVTDLDCAGTFGPPSVDDCTAATCP